MIPTYIIQSLNIETDKADLVIQVSSQGLYCTILENTSYTLLAVYHFKETTNNEISAAHIRKILHEEPHLQHSFKKVHVIYGYPVSVLVPHDYMNESLNRSMLELVYGDASERVVRTDFMYRHNLHNVYAVPKEIEQAFTRYFPFATHTHLYSLLPEIVTTTGNHLYCIFHASHVTAMLVKDKKLQLIQHYIYKTPADVAYHLLHICKSFESNAAETTVVLHGMMDEGSAVYDELYKYFLHLQFGVLPATHQYPPKISEYPEHFFSHLFQVSACV